MHPVSLSVRGRHRGSSTRAAEDAMVYSTVREFLPRDDGVAELDDQILAGGRRRPPVGRKVPCGQQVGGFGAGRGGSTRGVHPGCDPGRISNENTNKWRIHGEILSIFIDLEGSSGV